MMRRPTFPILWYGLVGEFRIASKILPALILLFIKLPTVY
jgi:hypothetical protein